MSLSVFIPFGVYVNPYRHGQVFGVLRAQTIPVAAVVEYEKYTLYHVTHQVGASKVVDGRRVDVYTLHRSRDVREGWVRVDKPRVAKRNWIENK